MESALRGRTEPGLKLIETFGWDGAVCPRLAQHLDRLARSAAALGWRCDRDAVAAAVQRAQTEGPARLRLTLDEAGEIAVETGPMPQVASAWRIGLAAARLASDDPWLGVKSTHRAVYDAARAGLAAGLDEVVFQNERGEICDGTITTLFFDRGAGLRTPPLRCGLLPGVLRESLLDEGLQEEVLMAEDLPLVRLWVGNSLRGRIAAVWSGR